MTEEVWKILDNFSKYEISSFGNIRNKLKNVLKPTLKSGYYCVGIRNNENKTCPMKIHRLVALTFIPNPENKYTVNHKDHNKENNNVDNLEWATSSEQNFHKRKCKKEIKELVSSRAVWRINNDTNEKLELYQTIKFAAQWVFDNKLTSIVDFNNGNNIKTKISAVCQKRYGRNTAFGYKWEYDKSNENKYENEIWKDIPIDIVDGIIGYKISNYGRVKNHKGRITEGSNHESGYLWVSIAPKSYLLHRLVAKVFIPNPENKEQVNHIDGNKVNTYLDNLEWCTNTENQIHKVVSGLNNTSKNIIQYDLNMNKIKEYNSQKEASIELNINHGNISKCCKKNNNKNSNYASTGGFIFKFLNDNNIVNINPMTKKVIQYDLNMNKIKDFNSRCEASTELNIHEDSISNCCRGKTKIAGGFIFKYIE